MKTNTSEQIHWKIFNFMAKLFSFGLVAVSSLFIALSILELNGKLQWLSVYFGESPVVPLLVFCGLFVIGIFLIKAKPFNPATNKNDEFI